MTIELNQLALARHVAAKFHAGQTYGDKPYTTHLESVAHMVKAMNSEDERLVVIAWLHDILEDTSCTEAVLNALFEDDVVAGVVAMSKGYGFEGEQRDDYLGRCKGNLLARQVKQADTFCNLRESLLRGDAKRIKKYGEQLAFLAAT